MSRLCRTIPKNNSQALARFLTRNGQALLPLMELIEQSQFGVDELVDVLGRASIKAVLRRLSERSLGGLNLLVNCLDGLLFDTHHGLTAMSVDTAGNKHLLGIAASENQVVAKGCLENLMARGLNAARHYLFVTDGSKALRATNDAVIGAGQAVQRCPQRKMENVMRYLPEHLKLQVKAALRGAFHLEAS